MVHFEGFSPHDGGIIRHFPFALKQHLGTNNCRFFSHNERGR
jgi:hypothetical protein